MSKRVKNDLIHPDLLEAYKRAYVPSGLIIGQGAPERESQEYAACDFEMNGRHLKFRVAKITPTKIGQFVTLWKRIGKGPIMPYDVSDSIDLFVVSVREEDHFGQFVFPKAVLCEKGLLSKEGKGGKRAMRIYPPWDIAENPQAKKTQSWQLNYFFLIDQTQPLDSVRIKQLFG